MATTEIDPMTVDLAGLDDDVFMDVWTQFGSEALAVRERLTEFNLEHQRRERKRSLARLGTMSEEDMALLQEIRAEGVESEAAVGTPGEGDES